MPNPTIRPSNANIAQHAPIDKANKRLGSIVNVNRRNANVTAQAVMYATSSPMEKLRSIRLGSLSMSLIVHNTPIPLLDDHHRDKAKDEQAAA